MEQGTSGSTRPHSPLDPAAIEAVVFDYGNTLVRFDAESVRGMNAALADTLVGHFGYVDREGLDRVRAEDRVQPFKRGYRENDLAALCDNLVRELYGQPPTPDVLDALLATRYTAMLDAIYLPDGVSTILDRLGDERLLGVLSNYPDGEVVRESMSRLGIRSRFHTVVVSGDVGYVKPHPRPFEVVAEGLGIDPVATLFVGDNWLADIQGAKRFGMRAVLTTQYEPPESFERQPGDYEPDAVIDRLGDLLGVLDVAV